MARRQDRRHFLESVGVASVAMLGTSVLPLNAAVPPESRASSEPWDMSWLERLKSATYRAVIDANTIEDGYAADLAGGLIDTFHEVHGTSDDQVRIVIVARRGGTPLVLGDAVWEKFPLGEETKMNDRRRHAVPAESVLPPAPWRVTRERGQQARVAAKAWRDPAGVQRGAEQLGAEPGGAHEARRRGGEDGGVREPRSRNDRDAVGRVRAHARAERGVRLHARSVTSLGHFGQSPTSRDVQRLATFRPNVGCALETDYCDRVPGAALRHPRDRKVHRVRPTLSPHRARRGHDRRCRRICRMLRRALRPRSRARSRAKQESPPLRIRTTPRRPPVWSR